MNRFFSEVEVSEFGSDGLVLPPILFNFSRRMGEQQLTDVISADMKN